MFTYRLNYIIYFLLVGSSVYVDSPFALLFGAAGLSPAFVFSFALVPFLLLDNNECDFPNIVLPLLKLAFWILVIGFFANVIYTISGSSESRSYNIFVKNINVFLQVVSYPLYLFQVYHFGKNLDIKHIFFPIIFVFLLLTFFCVLEFIQLPNAFLYLHFSHPEPYQRIRLLAYEASITASIIINFFVLSFYYAFAMKRNLWICTIIIFSFIVLIFLSSSKNLFIETFFFFLVLFVYSLKKMNVKNILLYTMSLFFLTFFLVWISHRLSGAVAHDLENYTSTATRTFSIVNGYLIGLKYPLGVGGGIWQQVLSDSMMENLKIAEKMMPNLNFNEIIFYCQNFSHSNTAKSALAQCCMYWGIAGTIYFLHAAKLFYNNLKKQNIIGKNILKSALVANLISISFQTDFQYDMFLLLAIPFLLYRKALR